MSTRFLPGLVVRDLLDSYYNDLNHGPERDPVRTRGGEVTTHDRERTGRRWRAEVGQHTLVGLLRTRGGRPVEGQYRPGTFVYQTTGHSIGGRLNLKVGIDTTRHRSM